MPAAREHALRTHVRPQSIGRTTGRYKNHHQTSCKSLRSELIGGSDAGRSESFEEIPKKNKHPQPINTTTTTHVPMDTSHTASQSGKQEKAEKNEGMNRRQGVISFLGSFLSFFFNLLYNNETHETYLSSVLVPSLVSSPHAFIACSTCLSLFLRSHEVLRKLSQGHGFIVPQKYWKFPC